jgi:hypothetical protein
MTTADIVERGKLDIGRVIQQTFAVLGRNIVTFSILGIVLAGIPTAVVGFLQAGWMRQQAADISAGTFAFSAGYFQTLGLSAITALITGSILQGALIYATVQDMNGQKPAVGDSLATGLRNFLGLIGVSILFGLAVIVGMVLFVVPGVMIACAWCVVAPALVADRTGVFGAFGRAADLTRGNRWRIFGLAVIVWVLFLLIGLVFNVIAGVSIMTGDPADAVARASSPLVVTFSVIESVVSTVIGATAISVLYVELRRVREGLGPQWLAEIFA